MPNVPTLVSLQGSQARPCPVEHMHHLTQGGPCVVQPATHFSETPALFIEALHNKQQQSPRLRPFAGHILLRRLTDDALKEVFNPGQLLERIFTVSGFVEAI